MSIALVAPPFGRDTTCTDRMQFGRMSSGYILVGEALFRRLNSEPGSLEYDPDYGFNVVSWFMSTPNPSLADVMALRSRITRECQKDERVDDVVVTINTTQSGPTVSLDISIVVTLVDDASTTFTLALNVADVTLTLLGITLAEAA